MSRFTTTLFLALAVSATAVGVAFARGAATVHVTIRHQLHGCHAWSVDGNAFKAAQKLAVARGTTIVFTDYDVMPHTLIQVGGPKAALAHAVMNHPSAAAKAVLAKAGTYSFETKAGED